jgi:hypothetical protein
VQYTSRSTSLPCIGPRALPVSPNPNPAPNECASLKKSEKYGFAEPKKRRKRSSALAAENVYLHIIFFFFFFLGGVSSAHHHFKNAQFSAPNTADNGSIQTLSPLKMTAVTRCIRPSHCHPATATRCHATATATAAPESAHHQMSTSSKCTVFGAELGG